MEYIIYYSDFGLQQTGKLGQVNHELNLKTLLLLSDKILIPASHLLHLKKSDIQILLRHFSDYFKNDYIFTQLPRKYSDFKQFSYDYLSNYRVTEKKEIVETNSKWLSFGIFPDKQHFRIYDSKAQVTYFYSLMTEQIKHDSKISGKTRHDILESIYAKSDENNPLSQSYFNNIVTELEKKQRRNIEHLKRFSEICYYSAGAYTNNAIISSNNYLDSKMLSIINSKTNNFYLSSDFYNARNFIKVLMTLGIIEHENEICLLTFEEISYLKNEKTFRKFLDAYYDLSKSADQLNIFLKKEKQHYKRLEFIKSLLFSFGLTLSEIVLTNSLFEISLDPMLYGIIIWILQTYIENSQFKPIKCIRYYTVDRIIDKIGFGNDFFLNFCHKLKQSIEMAQ